jgi:DNA polymerase-4
MTADDLLPEIDTSRKIIHIDMDAFFASVEQRDFPELRGKPVAVGGRGRRGVVGAASYEARKYGVRSAMPSFKAEQLCKDLIFVKPRFEAYSQVSAQVMDIFKEYTDLVEPLSLDEAYLDVTENKKNITIATDIAREIKNRIKQTTQLTASAGVSYCKFIAKVASGYKKPDGLTVIHPTKAHLFLKQLVIDDFYGIGKVTAEKMKTMGIRKGADLLTYELNELIDLFGLKSGTYYYQIVRGLDNRAVQPEHIRKSIGSEETFDRDLSQTDDMLQYIRSIAQDVFQRCDAKNAFGKTLTLKIKYHDFAQTTRSKTFFHYIDTEQELYQIAQELLLNPEPLKPVRLLGISVSGLNTDPASKIKISPKKTQLQLNL